jgi:ElaB/YqjD/DUF883 family membrane-anchored ribosome-binding protein
MGWHIACHPINSFSFGRRKLVSKNFIIALVLMALTVCFGCQSASQSNANANENANSSTAATTQPAPDNSEVTTTTDSNGTKTQTRVFRDNPNVSKVVVTTRDGKRTTTVYSKNGEAKEIKDDVGDALNATGDKVAESAGWVKDKGETAVDKTKEGANEVGDKAEDVKDKATSTTKSVAHETKQGAKTVINKAEDVTKKTGKTIKKVIP